MRLASASAAAAAAADADADACIAPSGWWTVAPAKGDEDGRAPDGGGEGGKVGACHDPTGAADPAMIIPTFS